MLQGRERSNKGPQNDNEQVLSASVVLGCVTRSIRQALQQGQAP